MTGTFRLQRRMVGLFLLIILANLFPSLSLLGQEQEKINWYCNFRGEKLVDEVYSFVSDAEADAEVSKILKYTGLEKNFIIKAANVPNAMATMDQQGRRLIFYNQAFMQKLKSNSQTDWAATSVLAHEVGHHLQGHILTGEGSNHKNELEADKYSGFILYKMGASLDQALAAFNSMGDFPASSTHPAASARKAAVTNGWTMAKEISNAGPNIQQRPVNPNQTIQNPIQPTPPVTTNNVMPISRCVFYNEPNVTYIVFNTGDIVAYLQNGQSVLVAKKIPPTVQGFAWMYSSALITYGVTPQGQIFNRNQFGQLFQIGYVTNP